MGIVFFTNQPTNKPPYKIIHNAKAPAPITKATKTSSTNTEIGKSKIPSMIKSIKVIFTSKCVIFNYIIFL